MEPLFAFCLPLNSHSQRNDMINLNAASQSMHLMLKCQLMINHRATVVAFYGRSHLTHKYVIYTMYKAHRRAHTHMRNMNEKKCKTALCVQRAKQDVNIALFEMITREN